MKQLELDLSSEELELEQSRDEEERRKQVTRILCEIYIFMPETARELAGLVGFKTELEQHCVARNRAA
jgi:hypothetical protein